MLLAAPSGNGRNTSAHTCVLFIFNRCWVKGLFKMAVICQALIIQSHKHKHRVMNLEESTHFHNRLCKMPLTRRGVFTPKFLFTSSLDNYSCSQHFKYDRVKNSWHWSNCREPWIQNGYINNFINMERALNSSAMTVVRGHFIMRYY